MTNELEPILVSEHTIARFIFVVRGQRVMLDRTLAKLYGVDTRTLNQAVRRNKKRFPDDFMFALTRDEIMNLSQSVISSTIKHAPNVFAFTEHGIAMLSTVLHSERAIDVNITIMRTFVQLKTMLTFHKEIADTLHRLEQKVGHHDKELKTIFEAIRQLMRPPEQPKRTIGFHHQ